MSGHLRGLLVVGLTLSIIGADPPRGRCGLAKMVSKEPANSELLINVYVYNYAQVSTRILAQAEKEAQRIFRKTRVETVWLDYAMDEIQSRSHSISADSVGSAKVILRILPPEMAKRLKVGAETLGLALESLGGDSPYVANVFYRSVEELVKAESLASSQVALILGCAIAHEIGHLFLGLNSHSHIGLMRANWDGKSVRSALTGVLAFTDQQGGVIRDEVLARTRQKEPSP